MLERFASCPAQTPRAFPRAINFHVLRECNAECLFCFAGFSETPSRLGTEEVIAVLRLLREAGGEKMNFVGGEPTLRGDIGTIVKAAKKLGFTTSIVSNGAKLARLLDSPAGRALDWVGLSIDSATDRGNELIGRGKAGYVQHVVDLARKARALGARVKLNTVVTKVNMNEDMRDLVRRIRPERWKLFQALRVVGQNEHRIGPLLVGAEEFEGFVSRHRELEHEAIPVVPENNDAMTDSYAMIDPMGRFFGNSGGEHRIGRSLLEVGADAALRSVGFENDKLVARGGEYDWSPRGPLRLRVVE